MRRMSEPESWACVMAGGGREASTLVFPPWKHGSPESGKNVCRVVKRAPQLSGSDQNAVAQPRSALSATAGRAVASGRFRLEPHALLELVAARNVTCREEVLGTLAQLVQDVGRRERAKPPHA